MVSSYYSSIIKLTLSKAVTLHTNYGNIKVEVFCDNYPVASEVLDNEIYISNKYIHII
jgi:hypothetical protein